MILINLFNLQDNQIGDSTIHKLVNYFPPSHLCSFILGISAGYFYTKYSDKIKFKNPWTLLASFALIYITLQYPIREILGYKIPLGSSFLAPIFIIPIIAVSFTQHSINKILSNKFFKLLGEASYGIYVFHMPLYVVMKNMSPTIFENDFGFYLYSLILITISIISFFFFEKPINRFIRKLAK